MKQGFFKFVKESKTSDHLTKRKYIRDNCVRCGEVIEYDARTESKHKGYCKRCRVYSRDDYIIGPNDIVYEFKGRKVRGSKVKCKACGKEWIIPKHREKKYSGYCRSCYQGATERPKTIEQIRDHIKKNVVVDKHGCWIWQKLKDRDGYGVVTVNTRTQRVHRLSFEVFVYPVSHMTMILHSCHNSSCCNPDHLHVGDNSMNMREMVEANRQARGEKNGASKLINEQVLAIKQRISLGHRNVDIAKTFGVGVDTIWRIRNGITWKHVCVD